MKTTLLSALCAISLLGLSAFGQSFVETRNGGGTIKVATVVKTAAYTARATDHTILCDATNGAFTVTIPSAEQGRIYVIKKIDATNNAVTVDPTGSQTIDGSSTIALSSRYGTLVLNGERFAGADTAKWHRISDATALQGDVTITSDATGGNLGASNSLTGIINSKLITFGTMTNGAASSAKTVALMDDTPAAEFSAVTVGVAPTDTQDATYARVGTNSLKLAWPATSVAGDGVQWTAFSAADWTTEESVGFWLMTSEAVAAGDLTFVIVDSTADHAFDIPAITTANKWTWVEVDISALATTDGDAVTNYKILLSTAGATAHGAFNTYFDGGYKWDATEELALGVDLVDSPGAVRTVLSLTKANTGTHDFVALVEGTAFFVHYESGNDFLVSITDNSALAAFALVNHK